MNVIEISSRENSFLKDLRRLLHDGSAYRKQGRVWIEGDHLCRAYLQRGFDPDVAVYAESYWLASAHQPEVVQAARAGKIMVVKDVLWRELSPLDSPAPMGFVVQAPARPLLDPKVGTVVLDRLQDAGNAGAILRSAAAFGFRQIVALKGTVALWSPKVMRAGMGAHFGLSLIEGASLDDVRALQVPLLATSSHGGEAVHNAPLPVPCAWAMGHEGQGVSPELEALAARKLRIAQPGGEESLNVAVAAGICLHASAVAAMQGSLA